MSNQEDTRLEISLLLQRPGQQGSALYQAPTANTFSPGQRGGTDSDGNALAFTLPDEQRLTRFLVLGCEGGTFYSTQQELQDENATCISNLIRDGQGQMVVDKILEITRAGRAIRMNAILLALAMCCRSDDKETKTAAYKAIQKVCKIPTHLFNLVQLMETHGKGKTKNKAQKKDVENAEKREEAQNVENAENEKVLQNNQDVEMTEAIVVRKKAAPAPGKGTGWGRGLRKAVSQWYNKFATSAEEEEEEEEKEATNPRRLAMLVTKYRQRDGWSHRDLMRLSHLKPSNNVVGFILRYAVKGIAEAKKFYLEDGRAEHIDDHSGNVDEGYNQLQEIVKYLEAVEEVRFLQLPPVKRKRDEEPMEGPEVEREVVERVVTLIQQHNLLREHLPTFLLNVADVWLALLDRMPMMALIRNLSKISNIGLLDSHQCLSTVINKIGNQEALRKAKVHPYAILRAWYTYREGKGLRGKLRWKPNPEVVNALEQAFYKSFGKVTATNKRILIALDVSGSMSWGDRQCPGVSPRVASTAMCLVTLAAESDVELVGFSTDLQRLAITKEMTLGQAIDYIQEVPMGTTDCSLPMLWAAQNNRQYDAFIVYTDCETWYSRMPPAEALRLYRQQSRIANAKLAVVAMTSNGFSLADPSDLNMIDIVGFDSESPHALQEFISGSLCE